MSGIWVFKENGVMHHRRPTNRKTLIHLPTNQAVTSYSLLENILRGLGWHRYYGGAGGYTEEMLQFHKPPSIDLISLPKHFSRFNSVHMYDIVVKNPNVFHVRNRVHHRSVK